MALEIVSLQLGPVMTNAYLVADTDTREAVVIDPAWDGHIILAEAEKRGWTIKFIWATHAHFDHIGGVAALVDGSDSPPAVALHPDDLPLWQAKGGAPLFGVHFDPPPDPTRMLADGDALALGSHPVEVRHAPGHTPGHVLYYFKEDAILFSGDVIFQGSVGRTDLPGGDWNTLINSIQEQVLTLPDDVQILAGHMGPTSVGAERRGNPFLG